MNPVEFEGQNIVFAKDQPEYLPLPAHRENGGSFRVTSCWRLTVKERIKILFTGRMWLQQLTFGGPLQPQRPDVNRPTLHERE